MKALDFLILALAGALFLVSLWAAAETVRLKPLGELAAFVFLVVALADLYFMWCVVHRERAR